MKHKFAVLILSLLTVLDMAAQDTYKVRDDVTSCVWARSDHLYRS